VAHDNSKKAIPMALLQAIDIAQAQYQHALVGQDLDGTSLTRNSAQWFAATHFVFALILRR